MLAGDPDRKLSMLRDSRATLFRLATDRYAETQTGSYQCCETDALCFSGLPPAATGPKARFVSHFAHAATRELFCSR